MGLISNLRKKWNSLKTNLANEDQWITVFQSTDEYSVRILKLKIEDNDIPAIMFDQRDSSYNAFGYIYLKVKKEDELKALELLKTNDE